MDQGDVVMQNVDELVEEHLWRLGNQTLPFAFHNDNRHQEGVLVVRELAAEIRLSQQTNLPTRSRTTVNVPWSSLVLAG